MADEAYRAVFLRVHPTGKMVLSLTTESDGKEARVRPARGHRAGCSGARRQGRPRGHRPVRGGSRLQHEPVGGTPGAIVSASGKIRDKARLLAGAALDTDPETLVSSNGGWAAGDGSDPAQVKTIEDLALYAHGTGALPPGVEGGLDAQAVYRD